MRGNSASLRVCVVGPKRPAGRPPGSLRRGRLGRLDGASAKGPRRPRPRARRPAGVDLKASPPLGNGPRRRPGEPRRPSPRRPSPSPRRAARISESRADRSSPGQGSVPGRGENVPSRWPVQVDSRSRGARCRESGGCPASATASESARWQHCNARPCSPHILQPAAQSCCDSDVTAGMARRARRRRGVLSPPR